MSEDKTGMAEAQFLGLVSLLANSALQQLGKIISPVSGNTETNLEGAKLTIDWLNMIKVKTENNLSKEEEKILDSYISNLRISYVDAIDEEKKKNLKNEQNNKQSEEKE